jgi:hypothetical protein
MPGKSTAMLDAFVADLHHVCGQDRAVAAAGEWVRAFVPHPRAEGRTGAGLVPQESAEPC